MILQIITPILVSLFWRFRGGLLKGWFGEKIIVSSKVYYSVGMLGLTVLHYGIINWGLLMLLAAYYVGTIFSHYYSADIGMTGGDVKKEFITASVRGLLVTLFPAMFMYAMGVGAFSSILFGLSGLSMGICHYIGYRSYNYPKVEKFFQHTWFKFFGLGQAHNRGEALFGLFYGCFLGL